MGGASRRNSSRGVSRAYGYLRLQSVDGAARLSSNRERHCLNDIVREKRGITPEMAARLAKYFGTSEQFWLNLQDAFAVHQVKEKYAKELKAIKPLAAASAG